MCSLEFFHLFYLVVMLCKYDRMKALSYIEIWRLNISRKIHKKYPSKLQMEANKWRVKLSAVSNFSICVGLWTAGLFSYRQVIGAFW